MAQIITDKVSIGISACLYNCPVRYNGRAFDSLKTLGREKADFTFTPVCPECLAGLGVPRMPIHLTGTGQQVLAGKARVLDRHGRDKTEAVVEGARAAMDAVVRAQAEAFIAKEASPSCGLHKARVGKRQQQSVEGSGVFGAMLLESGLFLIPDQGLANSLTWWDWRRRLHAWLWLKRRPIDTIADLYDAWHVVKFVVQETNRPLADQVGHELASLPKGTSKEGLEPLRLRMLSALTVPSSRSRIKGALIKEYARACKKGEIVGVDFHGVEVDPLAGRLDIDTLVRDLTMLERISFENELLFGTSPVLRRDRRRVAAMNEAHSGHDE